MSVGKRDGSSRNVVLFDQRIQRRCNVLFNSFLFNIFFLFPLHQWLLLPLQISPSLLPSQLSSNDESPSHCLPLPLVSHGLSEMIPASPVQATPTSTLQTTKAPQRAVERSPRRAKYARQRLRIQLHLSQRRNQERNGRQRKLRCLLTAVTACVIPLSLDTLQLMIAE